MAKERFESILNECDAHVKRLSQAEKRCAPLFPLSPETYPHLSEDQVANVDQLVYRFTKLQDALGAKLFPAIVSSLREDADSLTLFDKLAELEKAGAVPSAAAWVRMRETRNQLAHDYQDDPEEGSHYLNDVFETVTALIAVADQASGFVRDRVLPSLP